MNILRRMYGSIVLGFMVTLFWIVGGFSLLFLLGEERWGGWFLILSILAIALVVSSIIFTKFTREERREQKTARARIEERRVSRLSHRRFVDLQRQAEPDDAVESFPRMSRSDTEEPSREAAEAAVQSMRTTFQTYAGEPSPESVETAIRSARAALSRVSRSTSDFLALNGAEEALVSAQSWVSMALTSK